MERLEYNGFSSETVALDVHSTGIEKIKVRDLCQTAKKRFDSRNRPSVVRSFSYAHHFMIWKKQYLKQSHKQIAQKKKDC